MATQFLKALSSRRTYYTLNKTLPIPASRIQEIVAEATRHVPSSFNSQSNRVVVLFGAEHDKLWDIASDALKAIVPPENWEPTARKLTKFKGGAGTILFFEDQDVVRGMQEKFALYADKFPVWATQSDGMLVSTVPATGPLENGALGRRDANNSGSNWQFGPPSKPKASVPTFNTTTP
jgi:uncharacterized protein